MLSFKNDTLEKLCSYSQTEYPKECCGILLGLRENGKRSVCRIISVKNAVGEKRSAAHFLMDPLEIYKAETVAEQEGLELVGFYHSHPDCDAVASEEDVLHMIAGFSYIIVSVKNGICVAVKSFEKTQQTDTDIQQEILIKEQ